MPLDEVTLRTSTRNATSDHAAGLRPLIDWILVPVSAGMITHVLAGLVAATHADIASGWSWQDGLAAAAAAVAAGLKLRAGWIR